MKLRIQSLPMAVTMGCATLTLVSTPLRAGNELAKPFRVEAGGKPIDMDQGMAAPFVTDFDGDGNFDLLLGQRGDCKLRIYRNLGSNAQPRFGVSAWFKAGGVDASLPGG
jgi:hypothetical protein